DGVQDVNRCAVVVVDAASAIRHREVLGNGAVRNVNRAAGTAIEDSTAAAECSVVVQRAVDDVESVCAGEYCASVTAAASARSRDVVVEGAANDVEYAHAVVTTGRCTRGVITDRAVGNRE